MRLVMIILLFVFVNSDFCHALSDMDYYQMMNDSPRFREENRNLFSQWNDLKTLLKGAAREKALASQREWLSVGRDQQAEKYIKEGYTKEFAYARATHDRCAQLWALAEDQKRM